MILSIKNQPAPNFINTLINKFTMADESIISKNQFVFQHDMENKRQTGQPLAEKDSAPECTKPKKRTDELIEAYNESGNEEEFLKAYVHGMEKMVTITNHKVRQPVANILGMANLMDYVNSPEELKTIVEYMKRSALDLDAFTNELTDFIGNLEQKGKNKSKP